MEYLKKLAKSLIYMLSIILISTFLVTLLNYFNIFGAKFLAISKILIILISTFSGGFLIGKASKEHGWLEGIKLGTIFIILLSIFNYFIINQEFVITQIIYYLILIIGCILGSMLGINKKKN